MRQLSTYEPVKVKTYYRTAEMSDDLFGPYWEDMLHFVSIKHRIDVESARLVAKTIFRYIHSEVFLNGESFTVPGFGRFSRGPAVAGGVTTKPGWPITISRNAMTRRFENEADPEDAGPRDEE